MSYQDHLKTCEYCSKNNTQSQPKPTVRVKSASSYGKRKKLSELGAIIRGTSYPSVEPISTFKAKGASASNLSRSQKLKELAKMIRG